MPFRLEALQRFESKAMTVSQLGHFLAWSVLSTAAFAIVWGMSCFLQGVFTDAIAVITSNSRDEARSPVIRKVQGILLGLLFSSLLETIAVVVVVLRSPVTKKVLLMAGLP